MLPPPLPTDGQMLIKVRTLAGMTSSKNSVATIFCNLGVQLKAPVKAKGLCLGWNKYTYFPRTILGNNTPFTLKNVPLYMVNYMGTLTIPCFSKYKQRWATDPHFPVSRVPNKVMRLEQLKGTQKLSGNYSTGKMPVSCFANNELLLIQSGFILNDILIFDFIYIYVCVCVCVCTSLC